MTKKNSFTDEEEMADLWFHGVKVLEVVLGVEHLGALDVHEAHQHHELVGGAVPDDAQVAHQRLVAPDPVPDLGDRHPGGQRQHADQVGALLGQRARVFWHLPHGLVAEQVDLAVEDLHLVAARRERDVVGARGRQALRRPGPGGGAQRGKRQRLLLRSVRAAVGRVGGGAGRGALGGGRRRGGRGDAFRAGARERRRGGGGGEVGRRAGRGGG